MQVPNRKLLITPTLLYSQNIYEEVLKSHLDSDFIWLDLGCGHSLLPSWRSAEEKKIINNIKRIVGIDYDLGSLKKHNTIQNKVRGDASELPFKKNSFNLITSNMVFEHLDNPELQLREIFNILKPGGLLIFHTPNYYGYTTILAKLIPEKMKDKLIFFLQKRKEEDVFPTYYRINSEFKIREFAKLTGFNVLKIRMIVTTAQFHIIPPVAIIELLWIKMLMKKPFKKFRTNIIAILQK